MKEDQYNPDAVPGPAIGSLEVGDAEAAAVQQTPNRVTLESMEAKVVSIDTFHPKFAPHMTISAVEMENGFVLVGKSAPADPENFDADLGAKFAYEDAIRQLWPHEGYLLCEQLKGEDDGT